MRRYHAPWAGTIRLKVWIGAEEGIPLHTPKAFSYFDGKSYGSRKQTYDAGLTQLSFERIGRGFTFFSFSKKNQRQRIANSLPISTQKTADLKHFGRLRMTLFGLPYRPHGEINLRNDE